MKMTLFSQILLDFGVFFYEYIDQNLPLTKYNVSQKTVSESHV